MSTNSEYGLPYLATCHVTSLALFFSNDILWVKLLSFYFMAKIIRILIKIMFYEYIL